MKPCYLGIDIGSISTKGVIIDEHQTIIADSYLWTKGNPIQATKDVLKELEQKIDKETYEIIGCGTTGSARKLIGAMLGAVLVKNEITAHAVGTHTLYPEIKTILEIGGQDSKIILLEDGIVKDYAMNTLCAAGTGAFLSSQAKRLEAPVEDFGNIALTSTNPCKIAARCTVFAESDLVHKAQMGFEKKDIIAGLCESVAKNYLNNVGKGKKITPPIMFQGGVSKNIGVKRAFEKLLNEKVETTEQGHLMGAYGIAILAQKSKKTNKFDWNLKDIIFETNTIECPKCPNHCEVICIRKNKELLDAWGNRCERGAITK